MVVVYRLTLQFSRCRRLPSDSPQVSATPIWAFRQIPTSSDRGGPRSGDRLLGIHLGSFKVSGFDMHRYSILQYLTVYDLICSLLYSPSLNDMPYKVYIYMHILFYYGKIIVTSLWTHSDLTGMMVSKRNYPLLWPNYSY